MVNTALLSLLCLAIAPYYHTILYNDDGYHKPKTIQSELVQPKLNIGASVGESTPTEAEIGTPT